MAVSSSGLAIALSPTSAVLLVGTSHVDPADLLL
jgi:hypothetical protein